MKNLNMTAVGSVVLVCGLASQLTAQNIQPEGTDDDQGLMQRGFEMLFEGMRQEIGPSLDEMADLLSGIGPSFQSFLQEMGPALADMAGEVSDWSVYELPERLPNGDILIRRKPLQQDDTPAQDPTQEELGGVDI